MTNIEGFEPVVSENANVLVLGTMPGAASLLRQQYYGHPRNAFWPIMAALFDAGPELGYLQRKKILTDNGIAVWDVLQACNRSGSLDSNIEPASIRTNNFTDFFAEYRNITQVFFNGGMAEKLYKKHVMPVLPQSFSHLQYRRLPSTSPAYASLNLAQKLDAWKVIKQAVVK